LVFAYHCRRRQQIQIEDNTFVEAEWTMPRKVTDSTPNSVDAKSKDKLKAARFMALGIGMTIFVMTQESWKQHLGHAVLMTAYFTLALFWSFMQWQNRPRYHSLRSSWFVVFSVLAGLATLLFFNFYQYQAQMGSDVSRTASPTEVFTFNLVVALAYTVFVGILVWKRKTTFRSMPLE
jgi:uncharacterized membrane protein